MRSTGRRAPSRARLRLDATPLCGNARALEHALSDAAVLGYGAVGAAVSLLVVQVLPYALALAGGADLHVSVGRVVGAVLVIVVFVVAGAVVALLLGSDATHAKEPIAYGLGWQSLIGGFLQGRRAESG